MQIFCSSIESCDSDAGASTFVQERYLTGTTPIATLYSAVGGLWYRNIDWDLIFAQLAKERGDASDMQGYLMKWFAHVPNFLKPVTSPP